MGGFHVKFFTFSPKKNFTRILPAEGAMIMGLLTMENKNIYSLCQIVLALVEILSVVGGHHDGTNGNKLREAALTDTVTQNTHYLKFIFFKKN